MRPETHHGLYVTHGWAEYIVSNETILQAELYRVPVQEDKMQSRASVLALHQVGHRLCLPGPQTYGKAPKDEEPRAT